MPVQLMLSNAHKTFISYRKILIFFPSFSSYRKTACLLKAKKKFHLTLSDHNYRFPKAILWDGMAKSARTSALKQKEQALQDQETAVRLKSARELFAMGEVLRILHVMGYSRSSVLSGFCSATIRKKKSMLWAWPMKREIFSQKWKRPKTSRFFELHRTLTTVRWSSKIL